ncbi:hypothetical protein PR003_g12395 [Phytophthora rubi]|uniref:Uncharacterized protein n=1 Tax=Phytophthora rubi TaxID=129364 RepID=A0A6A4F9W8_9STRA|nr:hypothetical protein PR002_g25832 [Phytophthora rubi]KAE9336670.1 hypothetical protein PR003_g12395 [Phytophthora rubi]
MVSHQTFALTQALSMLWEGCLRVATGPAGQEPPARKVPRGSPLLGSLLVVPEPLSARTGSRGVQSPSSAVTRSDKTAASISKCASIRKI